MISLIRTGVLLGIGALMTLVVPSASQAATVETFTFTVSPTCCTGPFGTVKVTDNGTGNLIFSATLNNPPDFFGSGFDATLAFNLAVGPSYAGLTYTGLP